MGSAINCCKRNATIKDITNIDISKIRSPFLSEGKECISSPQLNISQINKSSIHSKQMPQFQNLHYSTITIQPVLSTKANSRNASTILSTSFKALNGPKSRRHENIELINEEYSKENYELIKKLLYKQKIIFPSMSDSIIKTIFEASRMYRINANVRFFQYDSFEKENKIQDDDKIYIIIKGEIIVILNNTHKLAYGKSTIINTKLLKTNNSKIIIKSGEKHIYLFSLQIEKYNTIMKEYEEKLQEEKLNTLKGLYLFSNLEKKILLQISKEIIIRRSQKRELLIKENTKPESLFVLIDGNFIESKNDQIISKVCTQFSIIGDITLLTGNDSFYSYLSNNNTTVYEIKYITLKNAYNGSIKYVEKIIFSIFTNSIKNCVFLTKYFSAFNIENLYQLFELKYYLKDTVIIKRQNKLVILLSGNLYLNQKTKIQIGNKGQVFKDILMNNNSSIFTNECVVLETQWADILKIIKSYTVKQFNLFEITTMLRKALSILKLSKTLSEYKLFKLSETVKTIKFKQDTTIILNGPVYDKLFIILSGLVSQVVNDREITVLSEGDSFGDFINTSEHYDVTSSFIATTDTECLVVVKKDYAQTMESDIIKKFNKLMSQATTINKEKQQIVLDKLYYVKDIGQGSYGKVYLVTDNKFFYAMKTAEIQAMDLNHESAQNFLNEKSIMLNIRFPFVVKLYQTFKTREYIFFLQEFVNGITLRNRVENKKRKLRMLNEVKFYGGILTLILDYLETKRIIHRDLKPDNLIIDNCGYLKAIDFGIAKNITGTDSTSTLIGTCQYMAPEISLGKSYSFAVDYWSMGVVLFEVFYGYLPFGDGYTDPNKIYKEIQDKNVVLPCDEKNEKFNDLLRNLLNKNPLKRIQSFDKIKSHPFYEGFDFDKVMKREMKPPFLPQGDSIIEHAEKGKNNLQVSNAKKYIPFEQFMRNNVFCSSAELDQLIKQQKSEDFFNDF